MQSFSTARIPDLHTVSTYVFFFKVEDFSKGTYVKEKDSKHDLLKINEVLIITFKNFPGFFDPKPISKIEINQKM